MRRTIDVIGPGISQIILSLALADVAVTYGKTTEKLKVNEISLLILDMIGFIFENMHLFVIYMSDDFEAILNLLTSLSLKSSPEVIAKTFKFQKEIYNLFWDQNSVQMKFQNQAVVLAKIVSFTENTNKLYFTCENIFFQRFFIRFYPQIIRTFNRL